MIVLLLLPICFAVLARLPGNPRLATFCLLGYTPLQFALVLRLAAAGDESLRWFVADAPARFFLLILSLVFCAVSVASLDFLAQPDQTDRRRVNYVVLLLLFHGALTALLLSANLALLWIFLEATTLLSASFIYFENRRESVEAAWKYLFICSIGIALAYIGVLLLAAASRSEGTLFFADLQQMGPRLDPFWLRLAFPFLLVGFATKAGLAPVHSWLPDAHAEAPSPVSALLSGALLNGAMLAILRLQLIMQSAGLGESSGFLLSSVGIFSVFTAAACFGFVHNYKRLLAWSSVENMGIIAIGAGVGGAALLPALLHLLAHSLTKTACFLTAGWIHHQTGSKEMKQSAGLFHRFPLLGGCWLSSYAAISGFPPFLLFSSKLLLFSALLSGEQYILALLLAIALVIAITRLGAHVVEMAGGDGGDEMELMSVEAYRPWAWLAILVLFFLLTVGTFYRPPLLEELLQAAAILLMGQCNG